MIKGRPFLRGLFDNARVLIMSLSNRRKITQADCDAYNRNLPLHLHATLAELEWRMVSTNEYSHIRGKSLQLKLCDRNYNQKNDREIMSWFVRKPA
jgi:hypothetical protein